MCVQAVNGSKYHLPGPRDDQLGHDVSVNFDPSPDQSCHHAVPSRKSEDRLQLPLQASPAPPRRHSDVKSAFIVTTTTLPPSSDNGATGQAGSHVQSSPSPRGRLTGIFVPSWPAGCSSSPEHRTTSPGRGIFPPTPRSSPGTWAQFGSPPPPLATAPARQDSVERASPGTRTWPCKRRETGTWRANGIGDVTSARPGGDVIRRGRRVDDRA